MQVSKSVEGCLCDQYGITKTFQVWNMGFNKFGDRDDENGIT